MEGRTRRRHNLSMTKNEDPKTWSTLEELWPRDVLKHGFTGVPNLLIQKQSELGIKDGALVTLLGLLDKKWDHRNPFPSAETLAKQIGKSIPTIRRHLRELEEAGLLLRILRSGTSNEYDLRPLIEKLEVIGSALYRPGQNRRARYPNLSTPPSSNLNTKRNSSKKLTQTNSVGFAPIGENLKKRFPGFGRNIG